MKTVRQLRDELADYPDDAQVTSAKIVIETNSRRSTLTYSARLARQLARLRELHA